MHATLVAAVLQSHMGPDEGQRNAELRRYIATY